MSLQVPKPKRNEVMPMAHRKHFARMITNGADYKEINLEHTRLLKKPLSRSTYQRIKNKSGVILSCETHRKKNRQYKMKHDDERRIYEEHCKKVILECHRRKFAIKLSVTTVSHIMVNESSKFNYSWLNKMSFTRKYVTRFMRENDLMWTDKKSDQVHIPQNQMDLHRKSFKNAP